MQKWAMTSDSICASLCQIFIVLSGFASVVGHTWQIVAVMCAYTLNECISCSVSVDALLYLHPRIGMVMFSVASVCMYVCISVAR